MRVKSKMVFQMEREHFFSQMGKSKKWNLRMDNFDKLWNNKRNLDNIMKYIDPQPKK